jgi:hypothetical protein
VTEPPEEWVRQLAEQHRNTPLPAEELGEWIRLLREQQGNAPMPRDVVRDWLWLLWSERRSRPPLPPLEATQQFLRWYVDDADGLDEVRANVARQVARDPGEIHAALDALETLIADPPRDGTLSWLVAIDANRGLDDPSDSGAIEFLHQIAALVRDVLDGQR